MVLLHINFTVWTRWCLLCLQKHWLNKPQCSSVCYQLCLPNTSKRRTDVVPVYLGHIGSRTFHNACCYGHCLLNQYLIFKKYYMFGNQNPYTPVQIVVYSFYFFLSSVQFSRSVVSDSLRPHESQHARPPCPSPTPGVHSDIHWVRDAIQPSHPLSSPSPPTFNLSQHQGLFLWVGTSHQVAKVLELQL